MTTTIYNRSCYSLMQSANGINDLIEYAKKNKCTSIGICEKNNLFSAMIFYCECKKTNINPIIGYEADLFFNDKIFPILFYPKNNSGYIELNKITFEHDKFNLNDVFNLSQNIFVIISYEYMSYIFNNCDETFIDRFFNNLPNNFYFSIVANNRIINQKYNEKMDYYLNKYNKNALAIDLTLYPTKEDFEVYKCLIASANNSNIYDNNLLLNTQAYLKDNEELQTLFSSKYLAENDIFANKIELSIDQLKSELPQYQLKDASVDSKTFLYNLCLAGLKKRLNNQYKEEYYKRLQYELDIIFKMNFEDYFLIIYDIILFSVRNDILVGPGRGSSVGCLVAYCLGITQIDPVKNNLYFERFLNPERISLPDIDIDFPDDKRDEVIKYVTNKYGCDKVARIITFSTFQAKAALKEAAIVLNLKTSNVDMLLNSIKNSSNLNLKEIYQNNKKFNMLVNATEENSKVFQIACKLENLPRYVSLHAAGIIISRKPLVDVIPLIRVNDCTTVAYTMNYLERLGLIKIDFLALRNLTIIKQIKDHIDTKINLYNLPLDDHSTYNLLQQGKTLGIFQLESSGMISLLKQIKPTIFSDLAVLIALYRPGPMDNINIFINNRNGNNIKYIHPDLKEIIQETEGIIVYQEQIMAISRKFAGFSLGKADILRKAISKKDISLIKELKKDFIDGCVSKGYDINIAQSIYNLIEKFASYGFNKAHSYSYAFVAYIMTYLKAHYPIQFYCYSLNSISGNNSKMLSFINEAKQSNIKFDKADINKAEKEFTYFDDTIVFGFGSIKNLSALTINKITNDRNLKGKYHDYYDFVARMNELEISSNDINILIEAGCCDCFDLSRSTMINNLIQTQQYCHLIRKTDGTYDESIAEKPIMEYYHDNPSQNNENEAKCYGIYFGNSKLSIIRNKYPHTVFSNTEIKLNGYCSFVLKINNIKIKLTKTGKQMAFIDASDEYGSVKLTIMPKEYILYSKLLKKDIIIYVEAKKNSYGDFTVNKLNVAED